MQIARWRRWPYEWPANVSCSLRWPQIMHEQASWAYQMRIDNARAPGTPFPPPVGLAIATFSHRFEDLWFWDVVPSITPGFSTTKLRCEIIFEGATPTFYEWRYEIISGDMFLWFSSFDRTQWNRVSPGNFFPQADNLEFLVRNAAIPEQRFRSFVTIPRTCGTADIPEL